jgi:hypothetical protein
MMDKDLEAEGRKSILIQRTPSFVEGFVCYAT